VAQSTAAPDLNKQNTKYAKFKKEIMDAGKWQKQKGVDVRDW
jgi:hypothetical protein